MGTGTGSGVSRARACPGEDARAFLGGIVDMVFDDFDNS